MSETNGTDNLGEKAAEGDSQTMPDRAEEKLATVPQNETATTSEAAQAPDSESTEAAAPTTEVTETRTEQTQVTETPAQPSENGTDEGQADNS